MICQTFYELRIYITLRLTTSSLIIFFLNYFRASVPCDYSGKTIVFHVDQGSNPNYIAVVIEFEAGDGDLGRVDLKQASSNETNDWLEMKQSWGAVWQLNPGFELRPPLSIRLTSQYSAQTLVAKNVIPIGWRPGATYRSIVNYF